MTDEYVMTSRKNGRRYHKDEDFDEDEVWSVVDDSIKRNSSPSSSPNNNCTGGRKPKISSSVSSLPCSSRRVPAAAPKLNPKPDSLPSNKQAAKKMFQQSSAPVNIPDYGRIGYGSSCPRYNCESGSWMVNNHHDDGHGHNSSRISKNYGCATKYGSFGVGYSGDHSDGGDEEQEEDMVPPHEYLARRLARSQISSFSVCEGIGRTHKGRDLCNFRNAILRKTGFLE